MPQEKRPLVVGLTGNIGSGKSTVLAYFVQKPNVAIIDADKLAHSAMAPGGPAYAPILERFGERLLLEDQSINRRELGKLVFSDPAALKALEAISHPAVYQLAAEAIETAAKRGVRLVLIEAIKLLDGGETVHLCDEVWVVTIDRESQLKRLYQQRGMDEQSVRRRLEVQSSQADKVQRADRVIDNSGSLHDLYKSLDQLWSDLNLE